jgi:predicted small metal-binding protein
MYGVRGIRCQHREGQPALPTSCFPIRKDSVRSLDGDITRQVDPQQSANLSPTFDQHQSVRMWPYHHKGRVNMTKVVRCDCGFVAKSESDEKLIEQVQAHAKAVHDMELSPDQVLAMAQPE